MADAKHTPGPWTVPHFAEAGNCQCGYVFSDSQSGMGAICTVEWGGENESKEMAAANARLIAAAPELLEALQRLVENCYAGVLEIRESEPEMIAARAAIAKATGSAS